MPVILPPPLLVFPRPAIIRPAKPADLGPALATFPFPTFSPTHGISPPSGPFRYISTQVDAAASSTTRTLSFGTVSYARRVFLLFTVGLVTTNITSVVNNAVAATRVIDGFNATNFGRQGIYYSDVPANVAATFVITLSAASTICIGSAYETVTPNMTILSCFTDGGNTASLPLPNVEVYPGGFALMQARDTSNAMTVAYSGTDPLVQDDLRTTGGAQAMANSVLTTQTTGANGFTITATSTTLLGIAASFFQHTQDNMLNQLDRALDLRLSNLNQTALKTVNTSPSGWDSVRSVTSHVGGKWYLEWTVGPVSGGYTGAGFLNTTASLLNYIGVDVNGISIVTDGNVYRNGGNPGAIPALSNGDIVPLAVDLGANLFWVRKGGGNWNNNVLNNPATGVGGIALPSGITSGAVFAGVLASNPGASSTMNFGSNAFNQTPPSGFSSWG